MNQREVKVYRDIMGANDSWACKTRALVAERGILLLNLIGSPGSGKTTLLEATVPRLRPQARFAVLEGDIETTCDADRLARLDVPVSQLLSGGACHLEAKMVNRALRDLLVHDPEIVFVENVGNMVCPAEFDIGEHAKIAVLSVTEGEEKPLKYPLLFREARAVVVTKIDLIPHLKYDLQACLNNIRLVNGGIPVFQVSPATGSGMDAWVGWIVAQRAAQLTSTPAPGPG